MSKKLVLSLISIIFSQFYASEDYPLKIRKEISVYSAQNKKNYQEDVFYSDIVDGGQLYALYDGHRGVFAAQYLQRHFRSYFELSQGDTIRQKMVATCKKLDEGLISYLKAKEQVEDKNYGYCGSTAVIVFIKKDLAYFVNVGDSRALLEENGKMLLATMDHKVSNEFELQRLKEAKAGKYIKLYSGCLRINGLAISRSFGDYALKKKLKKKCGSPLISAEPNCIIQRLTEHHRFLILASDGLWDMLTNEDVIQILHDKKDDDIDDITEFLVKTAIDKGSKDNTTVMLVDLL